MGKKFVARIVVDQRYAGDFMAAVDDMGEQVIEEFQIVALRKTRQASLPQVPKALPAPKKTMKGKKVVRKTRAAKGSALDDFIIATIVDKGYILAKEAAQWAEANGRSANAAGPRIAILAQRKWIVRDPKTKGRYHFKNGEAPKDYAPVSQKKVA